jgi:pentatricopeptide repeat protein
VNVSLNSLFIWILAACGRAGEYKHALALFNDMSASGIQPDLVAYNSLFFALRVANEADKAFELWKEMCGESSTNVTKQPSARPGKPLSPDIITVTDVIAALTGADGDTHNDEIDKVFRSAYKSGLVLRNDNLDSHVEVDLSSMSFPVARAACRFIFNRIKEEVGKEGGSEDISLITGLSHSRDENKGPALREFVQACLLKDFNPPINSTIPQRAQGIVHISKQSVRQWLRAASKID